MSQIRINNLTNKTGDTGPTIAGVSTVSSTFMVMPSGNTEIRGAGSGRAIVMLGATPSTVTTIDYFNTAATGNAVDFGNLLASRRQTSGSSNGHGGL